MSDGNEHASQRTSDARRSATLDAAPPVPPPPPRPREVDQLPADGSADGRRVRHRVGEASAPARRIQCPMCRPYSTAGELRMLLAHVSTAHSGEVINAQARAAFSALGRGACTTEGCGALRAFDGQPQCRKCRRRAPVRELSEGDVAPGNSSRPEAPSQAGNGSQQAPADSSGDARMVPRVLHDLPPDFLQRVRKLPAQTMLWIPAQFREAICSLTAELIEGSNAGDESAAVSEQARTKLLLAHLPKGCSTPLEMRTRLDLWRTGAFLELLRRIEGQQRPAAGRSGAGRPRGERARAMAKSGAYRKAVQSLLTASAELTPAEQQRWASETASRHRVGCAKSRPRRRRHSWSDRELPRPRDGVHFARLSGPGPSGMRPEHLRDMLGCNRRRAVNRLIRALHATEVLAAAGALPACWRWMLGSRLVFYRQEAWSQAQAHPRRRGVAAHCCQAHAPPAQRQGAAADDSGPSVWSRNSWRC